MDRFNFSYLMLLCFVSAFFADKVSEVDSVSIQALLSKYKTSTGNKAKDRWARVDLIVGVLAHHLKQEE